MFNNDSSSSVEPLPSSSQATPFDAVTSRLCTVHTMDESSPILGDTERLSHYGSRRLVAAFAVMVAVFSGSFALGGEWEHFASSSWSVAPFLFLAVFAYLGTNYRWAKVLTLTTLAATVACIGLTAFGLSYLVLAPDSVEVPGTDSEPAMSVAMMSRLVLVMVGLAAAVALAATGFVPAVRRAVGRVLPVDPDSFVHAVALVAIAAVTLMSFVPLLVLSTPPLLSFILDQVAQGNDPTEGRGTVGMLLDELYSLIWLVPATVLAVGYGVRRDFAEALERLGLRLPTWRQVAAGLGLATALAFVVGLVSPGIEWVWTAMGWPTTDSKAVEQLFAHYNSVWGAVVIGVVAGLGEELAVRGVLQPRLGIWLSNLFFTGLHALQYNWDALLVVFALGLVLGVIREKTNTTTSAIVHGTYDFLLVMAMVLQIPWFGE
jgi:uncharacterized protein